MENEEVKCKYARCLHSSKILPRLEALKSGSAYYHPDCYKTKEEIKQIIDLFKNHINPNPVYSQLNSVITNIVFTKKLGSELLLFGLRYYIDKKLSLNYPQGLYYVIQNKEMLRAYSDFKAKSFGKVEVLENNNESFEHKEIKNLGFEDILRG